MNDKTGGPASDRELLEMAAKAIGLTLRYNYLGWRDANQPWDPLDDDGDALRLAVALKLEIERSKYNDRTVYVGAIDSAPWKEEVCADFDIYAATRRAIVRAAAAIGSAM